MMQLNKPLSILKLSSKSRGYTARVTLYIQDINDAIFIQAKLSSIDLQHNSIPLFAVQMTKNGIIIIPWIIRLCSILLPAPAE